MNSVDAKTENVSLTQVISKYFFASFLPDSQEVVDELYENLNDGYFNLASLLTTKNKETKEFLENFLPKDEEINLFESKEIRDTILSTYESEKFEYGIPQLILEQFYDVRFRNELNKLTENILDNVNNRTPDCNNSFNLVLDFLKRINGSWTVVNKNERINAQRRNNTKKGIRNEGLLPFISNFVYDFSGVTERKFVEKEKTEKIDNIYSAYKVFGQGEYSKFLIGYKKNRKLSSLRAYIPEGVNAIYAKLNEKHHQENNTKDDLIRLTYELSDQKKYLNAKEIDVDKVQFQHKKQFQITEAQFHFIYYSLQKFNGDYKPTCLEDIFKLQSGVSVSLLDYLYENCKQLVYKIYKVRYDNDRYKSGLPFSKDEVNFIKNFFTEVYSYRLRLSNDNQRIFDKETTLDNGNSFELERLNTFEKMDLLERLEMVSIHSGIFELLTGWFKKPTWKVLKEKRVLDQSESFQEEKKKNQPLLSDEIIFKGGIDEGRIYSGTFSPSDFNDSSVSMLDMVTDNGEKSDNIEEYVSNLIEDFDNKDSEEAEIYSYYDSENDDEYTDYFMGLIFREFPDDDFFVRTMKKIVETQLSLAENKNENHCILLYKLFDVCDREHSYSPLWTFYKKNSGTTQEISQSIFGKQMKSIRDAYKKHFNL